MKLSLSEAYPKPVIDPKKGALRLLSKLPVTEFTLRKQAFNKFFYALADHELNMQYWFNFVLQKKGVHQVVTYTRIYPELIRIDLSTLEKELEVLGGTRDKSSILRLLTTKLGTCIGYITTQKSAHGQHRNRPGYGGRVEIFHRPILIMTKEDRVVLESLIVHEVQHAIDALLAKRFDYESPSTPKRGLESVQYNRYFFSALEARARAQEIRHILRATPTWWAARELVKKKYQSYGKLYQDTAVKFLDMISSIESADPSIGEQADDIQRVPELIGEIIELGRPSNIYGEKQVATSSPRRRLMAASLERSQHSYRNR